MGPRILVIPSMLLHYMEMIYFAYGSNMSLHRLRERIPGARRIGVAILENHRLQFHKRSTDGSAKCDAFFTGNVTDQVWGVLYEITKAEKTVLDGYEGLGFGYEIKSVTLRFPESDDLILAFLYYATDISENLKPYHWYKAHVITGARENGFPESVINAIDTVDSVPDYRQLG